MFLNNYTAQNSYLGILEKLDQSTKPCDDFYQYSCGGYIKRTHLRENEVQRDAFTKANKFIQYSLKGILEDEKLMPHYSKVTQTNLNLISYFMPK